MSEVTGSSAKDTGGAFYCGAGGHCALRATTVANSSAGTSGGGVFLAPRAAQLLLSAAEVSGNAATLLGGGVYCEGVPRVAVEGSLLEGNSAGMGGGFLYTSSCSARLASSAVLRNSATGAYPKGGFLYGYDGSDIRISGCRIEENVVRVLDLAVITDRVLVEPLGSGHGGGAFLRSSRLGQADDPSSAAALLPPPPPAPARPIGPQLVAWFETPSDAAAAASPAGALASSGVFLAMSDSLVRGGRAAAGGALAMVGGVSVSLSAVTFQANNATRGGVADIHLGASISADGCAFLDNAAEIGAVAFIDGATYSTDGSPSVAASATSVPAWASLLTGAGGGVANVSSSSSVTSGNVASNYGQMLATLPAGWFLAAAPATVAAADLPSGFLDALFVAARDAAAAAAAGTGRLQPPPPPLLASLPGNATWEFAGSITVRSGAALALAAFLQDSLGQHVRSRLNARMARVCFFRPRR